MKKICKRCGRNRRVGRFARDRNRADGKRIYCRDCISLFNKRYRKSPTGKIKHKKSIATWKKNNKDAIKKYNQEYYRRKKHVILYNQKARRDTIPMFPVDPLQQKPIVASAKFNRIHITINPKPQLDTETI